MPEKCAASALNFHIMSQSFRKLYVHIVFSTKVRISFIDDQIEQQLFAYLGGIAKNMECPPVKIGGYRNHVHILCILSQNVLLMKLVEKIKSGSSQWIKNQGRKYQHFYWQSGYAAFSVSPSNVQAVIDYIRLQKDHHRRVSYQEEFIDFLKINQMEFDERYIWE